MSFVTIFSAPKPFTDPHINIIQRNAVRSWTRLGSDVDVLLFGDEPGTAQAAADLEAHHIPRVELSAQGVPLVSSMFEQAQGRSEAPILAYVNADILLLPDFIEAVQQVSRLSLDFLLVGQRWDLPVTEPIEFKNGWDEKLRERTAQEGELHVPAGSDYFIFPRDCYSSIPPFVVGRAGWDNWMIYHALQQGWIVLDATPSIMVIHQNHDYSHLPGGKAHYRMEESDTNRQLAGGKSHMYNLLDIPNQLKSGRVARAPLSRARLIRKVELLFYPKEGDLHGYKRFVTTWLRGLRTKVW